MPFHLGVICSEVDDQIDRRMLDKFLIQQGMSDGRLFRSEAVFGGSQRDFERVDDMSVSRFLAVLFD